MPRVTTDGLIRRLSALASCGLAAVVQSQAPVAPAAEPAATAPLNPATARQVQRIYQLAGLGHS